MTLKTFDARTVTKPGEYYQALADALHDPAATTVVHSLFLSTDEYIAKFIEPAGIANASTKLAAVRQLRQQWENERAQTVELIHQSNAVATSIDNLPPGEYSALYQLPSGRQLVETINHTADTLRARQTLARNQCAILAEADMRLTCAILHADAKGVPETLTEKMVVNVTNEVEAAPVEVRVALPERHTKTTIQRNGRGEIISAEQLETDAV